MKLLDFITVNDFLSYLQSGDSQCKPIYDFYMRWLQQSNKKLEEQTTENFIQDIEQISNFFEVLNQATSMAVENIREEN